MLFYADLHVHSKYSRATSKDADLEHLAAWAKRKGIRVVGTGDFTHPAWFGEIREKLVPAEPGLYRLRPELEEEVDRRVPEACRRPVSFMLEVEISTIYKKGERTRKIHHLVYAAEMETAARFRDALDRIGNIESDGRPILGLDSRDLLETVLESGPDAYLVPAHAWTPWFAVLGSRSGFDSVEACYGDLSEHIFAVETGLSSDPAMNWRVSGLDRYRLVSNSDAHSPPKLGREACVFDTEVDYHAMRRALETGEDYLGTVEFFPEEGKYHLDGHRKCGVRLTPEETRRLEGECPECGRPVTVGVMHRVEELADRPDGARPEGREPYRSLVPLPEILSEVRDVGVKTKTVRRELAGLYHRLGPELAVLEELPLEEVEGGAGPLLAEAVRRLRAGKVRKEPGFDGEYGVIRLFEPGEVERQPTLGGLFGEGDDTAGPAEARRPDPEADDGPDCERREAPGAPAARPAESPVSSGKEESRVDPPGGPGGGDRSDDGEGDGDAAETPADGGDGAAGILEALDPEQRAAAETLRGPLLVVAGPGTGKTRTLTHRVAHLIARGTAEPEACLTVTFTRRAAAEMRERMESLVPGAAEDIPVTTFHGLGHLLLREWADEAGYGAGFRVADEEECRGLAAELFEVPSRRARRLLDEFGRLRRERVAGRLGSPPGSADAAASGAPGAGGGPARQGGEAAPAPPAGDEAARRLDDYEAALRERGWVDFDGLLLHPLRLLETDEEVRRRCRERWRWISVDELQDIDPVQYRLLRMLAPAGSNVCAIGDPDQSIYGFRGARVELFHRFREDYPSARVVRLGRNYRSAPPILEAARQAIGPESLAGDRELQAVVEAPSRGVVLHEAPTEAAEAEFVVHTVERLVGGTSYFSLDSGRVDYEDEAGLLDLSFSDFAVLYRTRAQAAPLAEALDRSGIPYQRRSHDRLLERSGVKALADALRELRAQEAPGRPPPGDGRGAGDGDPGPSSAGAAVGGPTRPVTEWLERAADRVRSGGGTAAVGGATPAATPDPEAADGAPGEAGGPVAAALELLEPLARRHGADLDAFLADLELGAEMDAWDPRADRVSLLTLHAAKGLEFPVVFIVGCEDGLLPLRWGAEGEETDPEEVAEERRLLFVGMTRARRRLFLSRSRKRSWRGRIRRPDPSPFLAEIEEALLERRRSRYGGDDAADEGAGGGDPSRGRGEEAGQLRLL